MFRLFCGTSGNERFRVVFRNGFFVGVRERKRGIRVTNGHECRRVALGFFLFFSNFWMLSYGWKWGVFIPENQPGLGGFPPRRRVSAQKWAGFRLGGGFPPKMGGFPPTRRISAQIWAGFRPLGGFPPTLGGFPPLGRVPAETWAGFRPQDGFPPNDAVSPKYGKCV